MPKGHIMDTINIQIYALESDPHLVCIMSNKVNGISLQFIDDFIMTLLITTFNVKYQNGSFLIQMDTSLLVIVEVSSTIY